MVNAKGFPEQNSNCFEKEKIFVGYSDILAEAVQSSQLDETENLPVTINQEETVQSGAEMLLEIIQTQSQIEPDDEPLTNQLNQIDIEIIPHGRYKWNKKNYCKFCGKAVCKLSRYIESAHITAEEVERITALPLKSRERRKLQEKVKREGNYLHNQKVIKTKKGHIMPQMRTASYTPTSRATNYLPCVHCK